MPKQKRVIIVNEGTFGHDYRDYIETIVAALSVKMLVPEDSREEPTTPAVLVEVFDRKEEVRVKVKQEEIDVVIFVSVGMLEFARELRTEFNRLTVFVLAGTFADGEPYLIPKSILTHDSMLKMI